jgi:membrane protease subunit (stomatin/prohibitin family)
MKQLEKKNAEQVLKAEAMRCFSKLVLQINNDPDPKAQDEITETWNCANCNTYKYCCQLADTLV